MIKINLKDGIISVSENVYKMLSKAFTDLSKTTTLEALQAVTEILKTLL